MKVLKTLLFFAMFWSYSNAQIPTQGLIGFWPLNKTGKDSSTLGNHGTLNNTIDTVNRFGRKNSAMYFSGNSVIELGCNKLDLSTPSITLSAWIKFNSDQKSHQHIFRNRFFGYALHIENEKAGISFHLNNSNQPLFLYSKNKLSDLKWHNVVVCIALDSARIYIDNEFNGAIKTGNGLYYSGSCMAIEQDPNSVTNSFIGCIDDVLAYKHCLSRQQIDSIYNDGVYKEMGISQNMSAMLLPVCSPNPISNELIIKSQIGMNRIVITTVEGNILGDFIPDNTQTNLYRINCSNYFSNIYFVHIRYGNHTSICKIIKTN